MLDDRGVGRLLEFGGARGSESVSFEGEKMRRAGLLRRLRFSESLGEVATVDAWHCMQGFEIVTFRGGNVVVDCW